MFGVPIMLNDLTTALYHEKPSNELFHYTSIDSLLGIVNDKALWATELKYLNDSQEFRYFAELMRQKALVKVTSGDGVEIEAINQFRSWIKDWFVDGALIFTTSFTEKGNVLSQWRGYCEHGKGVSLGFDPAAIVVCADQASFKLGRCVYDWRTHDSLATEVVDRLVRAAIENGPDPARHPSQCYFQTFEAAAADIIQIAVLTKHPAFAEEEEWRCVSQPVKNYVEAPIEFRSGRSSLIPFIRFPLPVINDALAIQTAIVGPSPNPELAFNGIARFLGKYARTGQALRISACQIPYRA
jgi:Protein of unknown function (DUF2971)